MCARQVLNDFKRLSLNYFYSLIRQNTTTTTFLHFSSSIILLGKLSQNKLNIGAGFCVLYICVKFPLRCDFCCFPHLQLFLQVFELALSTVSEKLEEPIKIYNTCVKHLGQLCTVFLLCFSGQLGEFLPHPAGRHEISVFICT